MTGLEAAKNVRVPVDLGTLPADAVDLLTVKKAVYRHLVLRESVILESQPQMRARDDRPHHGTDRHDASQDEQQPVLLSPAAIKPLPDQQDDEANGGAGGHPNAKVKPLRPEPRELSTAEEQQIGRRCRDTF